MLQATHRSLAATSSFTPPTAPTKGSRLPPDSLPARMPKRGSSSPRRVPQGHRYRRHRPSRPRANRLFFLSVPPTILGVVTEMISEHAVHLSLLQHGHELVLYMLYYPRSIQGGHN